MWGQGRGLSTLTLSQRIIPTRVGTRALTMSRQLTFKDHPHACGDKRIPITGKALQLGSSPRVWGQVHHQQTINNACGIIPTRVGTSQMCILRDIHQTDHPHACGDKTGYKCYDLCCGGSSPRVWGQVAQYHNPNHQLRIIPTRVGTRPNATPHSTRKEDHPHACGDKQTYSSSFALSGGSSPRVWGQAALCCLRENFTRIIPTRVGTRN